MTNLDHAMTVLDRIGQWTWSTSWQASVLILMILAVGILGRRWMTPRWHYALWMLVVARLLMPWVPPSNWSVFNVQRFFSRPVPAAMPSSLPHPAATSSGFAPSQSNRGTALVALATSVVGDGKPGWLRHWPRLLQILWLAGAGGVLTTALARQRTLSILLNKRSPVTCERVLGLLHQCQGELGLRRAIRVFELDPWPTPAVFGDRSPCLILPSGMAGELRDDQLRLVFLHELVHVRRHDFHFNWLLILVQAWHWFNPLVWLAFKRVRAERELVCDACVLQSLNPFQRTEYGRTLIRLAQRASGMGFFPERIHVLNRPSELKRRIAFIARPGRASWPAACASMLLILGAGALTFTTAAERRAPESILETDPTEETRIAQDVTPRSGESLERVLGVLEEELAKLRERISRKQEELEFLKMDLGVSNLEDSNQDTAALARKTLQTLGQSRAETQAAYGQDEQMIQYLDQLGIEERRKAAVNLAQGPLLQSLMEQKSQTEQTLIELQTSLGPNHPKVQSTLKLQEKIGQQIDESLDGIVLGLKAKTLAQQAALDGMDQAISQSRLRDRHSSVRHGPHLDAMRELENLQTVERELQRRLEEAKLEVNLREERPNPSSVDF